MEFSFNDENLINRLKQLPIVPTSKYGDIISMVDINSLARFYVNNVDILKCHLVEAEQRGLLKIIRSDIDPELFNGVKLL